MAKSCGLHCWLATHPVTTPHPVTVWPQVKSFKITKWSFLSPVTSSRKYEYISGYQQQKIWIYFHLQALCGFSINIYATEIPFCSKLKPLKGQPCWFTKGEQKKFGSWCTVYVATPACQPYWQWRHRQGLPDTIWQCSQLSFHTFQVLIFNKLNQEPNKALLFVYILNSPLYLNLESMFLSRRFYSDVKIRFCLEEAILMQRYVSV